MLKSTTVSYCIRFMMKTSRLDVMALGCQADRLLSMDFDEALDKILEADLLVQSANQQFLLEGLKLKKANSKALLVSRLQADFLWVRVLGRQMKASCSFLAQSWRGSLCLPVQAFVHYLSVFTNIKALVYGCRFCWHRKDSGFLLQIPSLVQNLKR